MAKILTQQLRKLANVRNARFITHEATFETKPFKVHLMDEMPATEVLLKREDALKMYKQMVMCRKLESAAAALYRERYIRGFCHLYNGQEAVCVGMEAALEGDDAVITSYRDHCWTYVRGETVKGVLTELTGRRSGVSRGKGGSMHMYAKNFYGGNGIVGAQVPLGAGLAFAMKYRGEKNVAFALYGDGASNQGQIFEALNIAKLQSLPVVLVCENNGYGMGTSTDRSSANTHFYTRGDNIVPGLWVDGMDVLSMMEGTRFLANMCREGKGPFMMEAATYRYVGHSMSDPGTSYRSRDEVKDVRQARDPISHFKEKILDADLVTSAELHDVDGECKKVVEEGVVAAKSDPEVPLEEMFGDIYANPLVEDIRGITPFTQHKHLRISTPVNI